MSAEEMVPAQGLAHVRSGIAAVRAVLTTTDLDARVPACPGWTLRDLTWHLGNVHRWVVGAIVEGHPDTPEVVGPADRPALLDWYDEGAAGLVDALAGADPDAPCWSFGPRPRTVRFWFRRQAHEHAVHVHDARSAAGTVAPIDPALAADGIDEVVTMMFPRQVRLGRIPPLERSILIRAVDGTALPAGAAPPGATATGRSWLLAGDGVAPPSGSVEPGSPADAELHGPAEALYLLLWHRTGPDDHRLTITGDPAAARAVLSAALTP